MRTGSCAVQQGLTAEAATVVKQAVTLAKRRGHAQVTPLHVANTMLAASNGLLRTACLQSHSHPLQCKALELCFNVALNRLPASNSSSPMLGPPAHSPSISNALVAAFKRAQAHQRRGSIESQQQPLLAVKIELEQLIISILDDPSVSRVMREAGFSSTQVKSNVEQAVSLDVCSQNAPSPSVSGKSKENNNSNNNITSNVGKTISTVREEDVTSVLDYLRNQRMRSSVLVGECVASLEGVVRRVMEKVEKGDVDEEGVRDVKFISLSLSAFGHVSRVQVENKIEELRNSARSSSCHSKGFILYVGDINWVFEYRAGSSQQGGVYYCPVEHMISEIGKLINGIGENGRFSVMGVATFQTYMRCRNGSPSLQTVWGLHPLTIPVGSLSLSLISDSGLQNESTKKADTGTRRLLPEGDKEKSPDSLAEPSAMFDIQVRSLPSSTCNSDSSTSSLPAWLQQCKDESNGVASNDQDCVLVRHKWSSASNSIQIPPFSTEKTLTFSSVSPSSSTSYDQLHPNFWISSSANSNTPNEPTLKIYIPEHKDTKQPFPLSNPNSTSSSDVMETEYMSRFGEINSENLKTLCDGLERKVPWQKDIIPEIVSTILQCRSGMIRRKGKVKNSSEVKEETWLLFQGVDVGAKEKIARELARLVFGSQRNIASLALSSFSSTRADSTEDCRNKRSRDERSCSYIDRFADAVSSNPHRVFLVEDIEQLDCRSQLGFKRVIERGRITDSNGEEVRLSDAIIILSCESFSSRSRACSPPAKQKSCEEEKNEVASLEDTSPRLALDLNISIDDDEDCEKDQSVDEIGLLESVDRRIIFKIPEL
ncbi:protein SMAX1-LIKE 3 [Neltuma alba]|uniref:protein SMAX1-LIKE 3 n=1 Tax=Neltuma alba TaxID=207710 RepID=UPI0010A473F0|nr:protein SMAX1-LIKE 3-like [Prosopis alba]